MAITTLSVGRRQRRLRRPRPDRLAGRDGDARPAGAPRREDHRGRPDRQQRRLRGRLVRAHQHGHRARSASPAGRWTTAPTRSAPRSPLEGVTTHRTRRIGALHRNRSAAKVGVFETAWFGRRRPGRPPDRHLPRLRRRAQLRRRRGEHLQRRRDERSPASPSAPRPPASASTTRPASAARRQAAADDLDPERRRHQRRLHQRERRSRLARGDRRLGRGPRAPPRRSSRPRRSARSARPVGHGDQRTAIAAATITSVADRRGERESAGDFILAADHCSGESIAARRHLQSAGALLAGARKRDLERLSW